MKKRYLYVALLGLSLASPVTAQVYVTEGQFFSTGVNNDGEVLIMENQCSPYNIWKPKNDINDITEIGGVSAGNGIGGEAKWTEDGKFVTGTTPWDNIVIQKGWNCSAFEEPADAPQPHHVSNVFFIANSLLVTTASTADGSDMRIRWTMNNGDRWRAGNIIVSGFPVESVEGVMLDGCRFTSLIGYMCGRNASMYYIGSNGNDIHAITPVLNGFDGEVDTYWAVDFVITSNTYDPAKYGLLSVEAKDGECSVWYTADGGDTYSKADGTYADAAATDFCYTGTEADAVMWLVNSKGAIQKSVDFGVTWTTVCEIEGSFKRIHFSGSDNGVAVADDAVYVTTDGGETWTRCKVGSDDVELNPLAGTVWNDACWRENTLYVFGTNGMAYSSQNYGKEWKKENIDDAEGHDLNRATLSADGKYILVGANDFRVFRLGFEDSRFGYVAGKYEVETDTWTPMECSGVFSQDVNSCSYNVSGDGHVLVGNSYQMIGEGGDAQSRAQAAAWVDGSLVTLPVLDEESNRATQSYATSYDGSVIAGWNDFVGPWNGCYWTRNDDGSYTQHMLLKAGVDVKDVDFYNFDDTKRYCFGPAHAVSPDGKWIGGAGTSLNYTLNAWLYNIETGEFKDLGIDGGTVVRVNNEGTMAVGYGATGLSAFIWTEKDGYKDLNDYAAELGLDYTNSEFSMISCVDASPNWRYLCGWGMAGMGKYAYMMDTKGESTGIGQEIIEQCKAEIYPNPVSDILHVALPYEGLKTTVTLFDLQGRAVKTLKTENTTNEIDVTDVRPGMYILDVEAKGLHKGFKVMVKH